MKKYLQRLKNERGLTLVELLAVVVILAIIATIAFVMIGRVIENSKQDAHIANAQQLIASAKLYEATVGDLDNSVNYKTLNDDGLIDALTDPWTKEPYGSDTNGVVTKSEDKYSVTLNDSGSKCSIDESESDLLSKDRKTICED